VRCASNSRKTLGLHRIRIPPHAKARFRLDLLEGYGEKFGAGQLKALPWQFLTEPKSVPQLAKVTNNSTNSTFLH
jgi:hypothetical protein